MPFYSVLTKSGTRRDIFANNYAGLTVWAINNPAIPVTPLDAFEVKPNIGGGDDSDSGQLVPPIKLPLPGAGDDRDKPDDARPPGSLPENKPPQTPPPHTPDSGRAWFDKFLRQNYGPFVKQQIETDIEQSKQLSGAANERTNLFWQVERINKALDGMEVSPAKSGNGLEGGFNIGPLSYRWSDEAKLQNIFFPSASNPVEGTLGWGAVLAAVFLLVQTGPLLGGTLLRKLIR
jgi:hypothetical protein